MSSPINIKVSEGDDAHSIQAEVQALIEKSGWELANDDTIWKTYHFATYTKVLDFNNIVGVRCKSRSHHPVTVLKFSSVTIEWTTHSSPGLSHKDIAMAKYCDEQAREIGTVSPEKAPSCQGPRAGKA